jgi:hypothetical protein
MNWNSVLEWNGKAEATDADLEYVLLVPMAVWDSVCDWNGKDGAPDADLRYALLVSIAVLVQWTWLKW